MTKERLVELVPIMQAWIEGKQIQFKLDEIGVWTDYKPDASPSWSDDIEYRIKPSSKIIPYCYDDRFELLGKTVYNKETEALEIIIGVSHTCVHITYMLVSFNNLVERYTFMDTGKPCGKEVIE